LEPSAGLVREGHRPFLDKRREEGVPVRMLGLDRHFAAGRGRRACVTRSPRASRATYAVAVLFLLGVAACGSSGSTSSSSATGSTLSTSTSAPTTSTTAPATTTTGPPSAPCLGSTAPPTYQHVVVVMMENRTWNQEGGPGFGSMPYLKSVAQRCAYYAQWTNTNPKQSSLTQYIGLTSGVNNPRTVNDCSPSPQCSSTDDNI